MWGGLFQGHKSWETLDSLLCWLLARKLGIQVDIQNLDLFLEVTGPSLLPLNLTDSLLQGWARTTQLFVCLLVLGVDIRHRWRFFYAYWRTSCARGNHQCNLATVLCERRSGFLKTVQILDRHIWQSFRRKQLSKSLAFFIAQLWYSGLPADLAPVPTN
jgi:hypothetical protein